MNMDKELVRDAMGAWAQHYAHILGVKEPIIKFTGERGACRRVKRAHIHCVPEYWNKPPFRLAIRRGTICINLDWLNWALLSGVRSIESLMAHEVSHMCRGKRPSRGHGKRMQKIEERIRGPNTEYDEISFAPNKIQWMVV